MSQGHWDSMRAHVESCAPIEGCGLLAGNGDTVREVLLITNQEQSPTRFRMDAAEQLRAFNSMEERGMELLGIFHSHTADPGAGGTSRQVPSPSDIREAAYAAVHVIWSRHAGQWHARGFWIEDGRMADVSLQVLPAEQPR